MNPKKEFVNAIMSVLRLEQNVYVTASIEEIIDRIEISDYTIFIAYLGEREYDYEKPIQTIAKAVDEFHEKKVLPTIEASCEKLEGNRSILKSIFISATQYFSGKTMEEFKKEIADNNSRSFIEDGIDFRNEYDEWKVFESHAIGDLIKKDIDWFRNKELVHTATKEKAHIDIEIFTKFNIDLYDVLVDISENKITPFRSIVEDQVCKPSVVKKIENKANMDASKETGIEHNKVMQLVDKTKNKIVLWG